MASLARLRRAAHSAAGFQWTTQLAGTATLLTLTVGIAAWLADADGFLAGAMIANAVAQVSLVAAALALGLSDDKPAMPLHERLALLGLFLATYAVGVAFAGWGAATTVLIAAYAAVLSALGVISACGLAVCLARMLWKAGGQDITRVLGGVMLLGGLAWMSQLGGPQPDGFDGLLRIFTLQAMAALTIATGGMMVAAIRLR